MSDRVRANYEEGAIKILRDLVDSYNACFDPDVTTEIAARLGAALENAEDFLSVVDAEGESGTPWEEVKRKAGLD